MALMQCSYYSNSLGMCCMMNVIVPQPAPGMIGMNSVKKVRKDYRVLYLLHGCSDDHSIWLRRTNIERYVADQELVVVMPAVQRSYYTDMVHGGKYWTFISEELPEICQALFPISTKRQDTFVAGLSMGGFGTLKLLLNKPEKFAGGAAFSSVVDLRWHEKSRPDEWTNIFGNYKKVKGSINDLPAMASKLAAGRKAKPKIFQCCGTEDFLYQDNLKFRDHLSKIGLKAAYKEYPGNHSWEFWDRHIVEGLEYIGAIVRN